MQSLMGIYQDPAVRAFAQVGGLLLARILPVVVLTPMLGGQMLPRRFRFAVAVLMAVVLLPGVAPSQPSAIEPMRYLGLIAKEAVVGLTLSTMVVIMFGTFAAVGSLLDLFRGATIANVLDPTTRQQQSLLANFFTQLATVLFLTLGGLHVIFEALGDSLGAIPLTEAAPEGLAGGVTASRLITLTADLLSVSLRLSAPGLVILLLVDVVLGLLNRVAPQVQVYFIGLTIKATLGIFVLLLAIGITFDLMHEQFRYFLRALIDWIQLMR